MSNITILQDFRRIINSGRVDKLREERYTLSFTPVSRTGKSEIRKKDFPVLEKSLQTGYIVTRLGYHRPGGGNQSYSGAVEKGFGTEGYF